MNATIIKLAAIAAMVFYTGVGNGAVESRC